MQRLTICLLLTAVAVLASPASAAETSSEPAECPGTERRIVAMGDIHGAYDAMRAILEHAEIVDRRGRWIAGDTIFVQTGDMIDRGGDSLRVVDWLFELREKAAKQGGEVILLLGNHETMNLLGDLRYVTPAMRKPFLDDRSDFRVSSLCTRQQKILRQYADSIDQPPIDGDLIRTQCRQEHPPGLIEYFETFSPKGKYGKPMREMPVLAEVDGVAFVHGGLGPAMAGKSVEEINRLVREDIARWDRLRAWMIDKKLIHPSAQMTETLRGVRRVNERLVLDPEAIDVPEDFADLLNLREWTIQHQEGPLWFRGFAKWIREEADAELPEILRGVDARYFAVGHTPQRRQTTRFDGQIFLLDTGMLAEAYKGVPSVLDIRDGRFTAVYLDGTELLHDCRDPRPETRPEDP